MILVAGLTPAWQQIMAFAHLRPGEVNRAIDVQWCASGKATNAAIALASLGAPVHLLSPAGGWSGQAMQAEFADRQTPATWIAVQAATRVCTTLLNQVDGGTTELVENAAALSESEMADFTTAYRELVQTAKTVVLTGSLPKGMPALFYKTLLECTPCPVVLDARGQELLSALASKPRVVKPNREELAITVGRSLPDRAAVLAAMRELIAGGASSVIVTAGRSAVLAMEADRIYEFNPLEVSPMINPIGCGDCLAAGVASALVQGEDFPDAVRRGIAAAADNLMQLLPARLSRQRVDALRTQVRGVLV